MLTFRLAVVHCLPSAIRLEEAIVPGGSWSFAEPCIEPASPPNPNAILSAIAAAPIRLVVMLCSPPWCGRGVCLRTFAIAAPAGGKPNTHKRRSVHHRLASFFLDSYLTNCKIAAVLASQKELVVLNLLSRQRELYGLQMVDASAGALKRGTIYVTLSRMERKGYVQSSPDPTPSPNGPPRRLYRITPLGRSVWSAWRTVRRSLNTEPAT